MDWTTKIWIVAIGSLLVIIQAGKISSKDKTVSYITQVYHEYRTCFQKPACQDRSSTKMKAFNRVAMIVHQRYFLSIFPTFKNVFLFLTK